MGKPYGFRDARGILPFDGTPSEVKIRRLRDGNKFGIQAEKLENGPQLVVNRKGPQMAKSTLPELFDRVASNAATEADVLFLKNVLFQPGAIINLVAKAKRLHPEPAEVVPAMRLWDVALIKQMAEEATPGPWNVENRGTDHDWDVVPVESGYIKGMFYNEADAIFVAATRKYIPELVAEVHRLRSLLEQCLGFLLDQNEITERYVDLLGNAGVQIDD